MNWTAPVDIYCERVGPAFWAEPINAVSNAAFIIAALIAAYTARRHDTPLITWVLIVMAALIGIGSFLFHTYATVWAGFADTVPIWSFVVVYVLTAFTLIGGTRPRKVITIAVCLAGALTVLFIATFDPGPVRTLDRPPDPLNGSGQYAPAVVTMLFFTVMTQIKRHPIRWWFLAATVIFAVSLGFRTVDMAWCRAMPIGTHYIWHILNGTMIGLLLQALIRHGRPVRA